MRFCSSTLLRLPLFTAVGWFLGTGTVCMAASPSTPAVLTVTKEIAADSIEPIGANLTAIAGGTNFAINNHVWNSGFEPAVWRKFVRVERAGENWFEWDSHGGPGYWNLAWTGLGNGATVRLYRIVDQNGKPLPYADGKDMNDISGAHRVVLLGEDRVPVPSPQFPEGGYIANDGRDGDATNDQHRVYLQAGGHDLKYGDYVYMTLKTMHIPPEASPPDLRQHYRGDRPFFTCGGSWRGQLVPHPGTLPPEFEEPGESCLLAEFLEEGKITLEQYVYHKHELKGEGQWYSQLHPGAAYRVDVWLRQEGLGNGGQARFRFRNHPGYEAVSQPESASWQVTGQWRKFSYEFTAPAYPTGDYSHISHGLEFSGPGKVWIDNFVLYRNDEKHEHRPFTPHEVSFDEFMASSPAEGKKPAMRFYGPIYHPSTVEALMGNYGNSQWEVAWNMGFGNAPIATLAQSMYWAYRTGDSPETRVVPHLTFNEEYVEADWMALAEYLGVPYDPAVDRPDTKPHAYRRYRARGNNGRPWTDEFREILVEYGNETWHNGAGGYGWDGWGRPGFVHHGGAEYGLFARYMFDEHVMKMPAWTRYKLGDKIKFVLGGNYNADLDSATAYAEQAAMREPSVAYLGHANYVGPKWETGDKAAASSFSDDGIQETLISRVTGIGRTIEDAAASRDALAQRGIHYNLLAYEGGPSGYWQNKEAPEIDELYGKSAAMGLAALDAWLYSSYHGFKHQCYLGFASGKWWSSHTLPEAGGLRPHVGWLALQLRNRHAPGNSMRKIAFESVPTYQRQGETIPLLAAYAITGDRSCSLFLLNRKMAGRHGGTDFGAGTTAVTVRLPMKAVVKLTVHKIARADGSPADPRDNNLESQKVSIVSQPLPPGAYGQPFIVDDRTGALPEGLPPGAIYLYVFEW
ncbi:MAG: hypothetical protein U1E05_05070 [Patescibacteria group bacterium]|nr:hypothetical protein [Patescibacteria group bacterium]